MRSLWKLWMLATALLAVLILPAAGSSRAQDNPTALTPAIIVRSLGMIDTDGTALYAIQLDSASDQPLENLTIRSTVPPGLTFVEPFWQPAAAEFVGEADGVVTWTLPSIAWLESVGPFAYRVSLAEDSEAPASAAAEVTWTAPEAGAVEAEVLAGTLAVLQDIGAIAVEVAGVGIMDEATRTIAPAPVGETGLKLYVPAGAVSAPTVLTFKKLPINEDELPEGAADYWWCTLVLVTAEPEVEFSAPVMLWLPIRKPIAGRLPAQAFTQPAGGDWQRETIPALVENTGTEVVLVDLVLNPGATGQLVAVGTRNDDRVTGTVTPTSFSVYNLDCSCRGQVSCRCWCDFIACYMGWCNCTCYGGYSCAF